MWPSKVGRTESRRVTAMHRVLLGHALARQSSVRPYVHCQVTAIETMGRWDGMQSNADVFVPQFGVFPNKRFH